MHVFVRGGGGGGGGWVFVSRYKNCRQGVEVNFSELCFLPRARPASLLVLKHRFDPCCVSR
jgi:hypothetical protein